MSQHFVMNCEEEGNDLGSGCTFSSGSSHGEQTNYQEKFEAEKERNRKLHEKLDGYKTVVNQFSKEQDVRAQLKNKIAALEKELEVKSLLIEQQAGRTVQGGHAPQQQQAHEQVFTELTAQPASGLDSKATHSPSFVVIQHCAGIPKVQSYSAHQGVSLSQATQPQDTGDKPHSSNHQLVSSSQQEKTSSETFLPPVDAVATPQSEQRNQPLSNNNAGIVTNSIVAEQLPLATQQRHHPLPNSTQVPPTVGIAVTSGSNPPTSVGPTGLVSITAWTSGQPVKPQWQMEREGLVSRAVDSSLTILQQPPRQHPVPNSSFYSAEGLSSSTPIIPGPANPQPSHGDPYSMQVVAKAELPATGSPVLPNTNPATANGTAQTLNSTQPPLLPGHTNISPLPSQPAGINQPTISAQTLGVGARPKSTNSAVPLSPSMNLFGPAMPVPGPVQQSTNSSETGAVIPSQRDIDKAETGEVEQSKVATTTLPENGEPFSHIPASKEVAAGEHDNCDEQWVNIHPEDLTRFPSLSSVPLSPKGKQNLMQVVAKKQEKTNNDLASVSRNPEISKVVGSKQFSGDQVLASPSDEDSQLASQAHSIVALVGPQTGISDTLYQFAQTASRMEAKLLEYQALVQRQQVQIQRQHSNEHSNEQELQKLRQENASLLAYINKMRDQQNERRQTLQEPGWTSVEMPVPSPTTYNITNVTSAPSMTPETARELKSLEEINTRLFQANKEWFTKWELLRRQTSEEKEDLQTKLQTSVVAGDKLRQELNGLEEMLSEAVSARQEEKKLNLQLEQEKLNMKKKLETLRTQTETLSREKRQLQADIAVLKAAASKHSENEGKSYEEVKTKNTLLKQQLKVFQEDFQKEREDRAKAEAKADKLRKEREAMKQDVLAKTKKTQAVLKTKEEDIRQKAKQLASLQYQLDELKQELQLEKQKNQAQALTPLVVPSPRLIYPKHEGPSPQVLNRTFPLAQASAPRHPLPQSQQSPEHLPGAWQCRDCTFINFPERTVCDICGWKNLPGEQLVSVSDSTSGRGELKSRGPLQNGQSDVEIDAAAGSDMLAEAKPTGYH